MNFCSYIVKYKLINNVITILTQPIEYCPKPGVFYKKQKMQYFIGTTCGKLKTNSIAGSSNGRTHASGACYLGSNPSPAVLSVYSTTSPPKVVSTFCKKESAGVAICVEGAGVSINGSVVFSSTSTASTVMTKPSNSSAILITNSLFFRSLTRSK